MSTQHQASGELCITTGHDDMTKEIAPGRRVRILASGRLATVVRQTFPNLPSGVSPGRAASMRWWKLRDEEGPIPYRNFADDDLEVC